jgi:dTDP-D-glucose 4,6-dehydratase
VAFDQGLRETADWYRQNEWWWRPIKEQDPAFKDYYLHQYGQRQG